MSGAWERCRRRSHSRLPTDFCFTKFWNVAPRIFCALASSKPDEIHCCNRQGYFLEDKVFKSQRHSKISFVPGKKPISRNGFIRGSGSCSSAPAAKSAVVDKPTVLTISPRLTDFVFALELIAYQLMRAKVTPRSFTEIQVPPLGSDGASTRRPLITLSTGGKPATRINFSSRFIASA